MAEETDKVEKKESSEKFFDIELKITVISAIIGAFIGYFSFLINSPPISFVLAVVVLAVVVLSMKKLSKDKKNMKWWLSNSAIVYLLAWFVVWTIFFNTQII